MTNLSLARRGLAVLCATISLALGACSSDSDDDALVPAPGMAIAQGSVFGGAPVRGATVVFVDAHAAAASGSIQPVEDLAATSSLKAVTDRDGRFQVEVGAGRYFVHVIPAAADDVHLPGGSLCRESISLREGSTTVLSITLSEKPPENATYVGSSRCLECHTNHLGIRQTLHYLGFRALGPGGPVLSSLQDLSRFPEANVGLTYYPAGNPNDNTGPGDAYGYRLDSGQGYSILLGRDGTGYFQAIESADGLRVSERLYVPFTYGGEGRFKQRYVTRLDASGDYTATAGDGSYYVLPGQFSETRGRQGIASEVTVPEWVAYHPERWAPPAADGGPVSTRPEPKRSFDNDCAGCHFTGMSLTRDGDGSFQAHAVSDPGGPIDYDGDGNPDEMNVGCERCHGPGSQHAAMARGYIVQPEFLPPGRANLVCGQCHNRGAGNGTIDGEGEGGYPSRNHPGTGDFEVIEPGLSPAEFFGRADGRDVQPLFGTMGGFFDPIDFATSSASWKDRQLQFGADYDHSKSHRQQYLDHTRSPHTQNPYHILACWDCHDPHEREYEAQVSERSDNNVLCFRCHAGHGDWADVTQEMVDDIDLGQRPDRVVQDAVDQHVIQRTFEQIGVAMNLGPAAYANPAGDSRLGRCTTCHMAETAKTASWVEDRDGFVIRGDIASHTFDVISPEVSEAMAAAGTDPVPNSCVECHRGPPGGAWPDYRYRK